MLKAFPEKMWVVQKLLTFFSAKNIRILYIESAKTVNKMTLNEPTTLNNWALIASSILLKDQDELLTLLTLKLPITKIVALLCNLVILKVIFANSEDPDHTVSLGAVWSGSTLLACMQK